MKRVLAVRQDNNGDVILAGPALRALAAAAEVTLICGPSGEAAARLLPRVARVLRLRADWIEGDAQPIDSQAIETGLEAIRALAPDEAFIFTSFHQSPLPMALLLRLAGVPRIHAVSVDYPGSLLDTRLNVADDIHEVERALSLVRAAGYALPPGDDARLQLTELPDVRSLVGRGYIAVQPGATVPARRWNPARLRALVARLAALTRVVVVGSADERALVAEVVGTSGALDLAGRTSFAEFAAVIAAADALVVGNTSGIHVASATGTPVVTIFPPTIAPVRFAPWSVPHVMLGQHDVACAGCRARSCPLPVQICTDGVTPDDVLAALDALGALRARQPA